MPLPRSSWVLLAVSLALTFGFIAWAWLVFADEALPALDSDISITFKQRAEGHQARRAVMIGLTHSGGVPAMVLLALVGALWQLQRGDKTLALAWVIIVAGGGGLNFTLKNTFDRPRPPVEWRDAAVTENNLSFPSGHSMGSLVGYGMLGYASLHALRRRDARIALAVLLTLLIAGIGFSRIYLRAHWFSDVIGGFLIGAAWICFCLAWVQASRSAVASRLNNPAT